MFPENRGYIFSIDPSDHGLLAETKHLQYHKEKCTNLNTIKLKISYEKKI